MSKLSKQIQASKLAEQIEAAVWVELGRRRWFGKHVEDEDLDALETDLRVAIDRVIDNALR